MCFLSLINLRSETDSSGPEFWDESDVDEIDDSERVSDQTEDREAFMLVKVVAQFLLLWQAHF